MKRLWRAFCRAVGRNTSAVWAVIFGTSFTFASIMVLHISAAEYLGKWLPEMALSTVCAAMAAYALAQDIRARRAGAGSKRRKPPLSGLIRLADILPLPTRKKLKALAGDYDPEIRRLRRAHRHRAATWNSVLAWLIAIRIVLGAPVEWALRVLLKLFRGA